MHSEPMEAHRSASKLVEPGWYFYLVNGFRHAGTDWANKCKSKFRYFTNLQALANLANSLDIVAAIVRTLSLSPVTPEVGDLHNDRIAELMSKFGFPFCYP